MSKIVVLKISDEDLDEEEGLDVIRQVLDHLGLRATIVEQREESRYWIIDNLNEQNYKDLENGLDDLVALVDEESGGIIGYLLPDHADDLTEQLNGTEPR